MWPLLLLLYNSVFCQPCGTKPGYAIDTDIAAATSSDECKANLISVMEKVPASAVWKNPHFNEEVDISIPLTQNLKCVPFWVDQHIDVAGSDVSFTDHDFMFLKPITNAEIVRKLRSYGAVLMGKIDTADSLSVECPSCSIIAGIDSAGELQRLAASGGMVAVRPKLDTIEPEGRLPKIGQTDNFGFVTNTVADARKLLKLFSPKSSVTNNAPVVAVMSPLGSPDVQAYFQLKSLASVKSSPEFDQGIFKTVAEVESFGSCNWRYMNSYLSNATRFGSLVLHGLSVFERKTGRPGGFLSNDHCLNESLAFKLAQQKLAKQLELVFRSVQPTAHVVARVETDPVLAKIAALSGYPYLSFPTSEANHSVTLVTRPSDVLLMLALGEAYQAKYC